jgi:aerobic-type carbon monoxide dehydrogenase small subunit (CoxS/CutS family)
MFQIETLTGTGSKISLFLIEMAAVTDSVLQCGVCQYDLYLTVILFSNYFLEISVGHELQLCKQN